MGVALQDLNPPSALANNRPDAFEDFVAMVVHFHEFETVQFEAYEATVFRIVFVENMGAAV